MGGVKESGGGMGGVKEWWRGGCVKKSGGGVGIDYRVVVGG